MGENQNSNIFIHKNALNAISKIYVILFRPHQVNYSFEISRVREIRNAALDLFVYDPDKTTLPLLQEHLSQLPHFHNLN